MNGTNLSALLVGALLLATGTAASAAEAQSHLQKTANGYRWEHDGFAFDLVDRGARWSADEARIVGESLDKQAVPLLRRAKKMKVKTFHRDKLPVGRSGAKDTASATTWIEKGAISYGDVLFKDLHETWIYATVTHELGHVAQYSLLSDTAWVARMRAVTIGTPGWSSISWTSVITSGMKSWNGFVSDYARTNDREDFAESVEFYWLNPSELARVNPTKFRFMRDKVFEGVMSPPETRDSKKKAIDAVRPEITKLGDKEDTPLSLVKVYGKRFMGPLDGGYNTVRYRGKRALHTPVSRTKIWSWVPAMGFGSAPITVRTQDGLSNESAFKVKKPWWHFW
ncbi:MAG: hypothetical protein AB7N76_26155 [Planctomycetota bacterium]